MLCLTCFLVASCALGNGDLWATYEEMPLQVENVVSIEDPWIHESLALNDGTYFISKKIGQDYYFQRCSQQDDSVLFTFRVYTDTLVGVTLFNDYLYLLSGNFKSSPTNPSGELQLEALDNETMEVQKTTYFPFAGNYNFRKVSLVNDETGVYVVCLAQANTEANKILMYTLDLEFVAIATFTFYPDAEHYDWLKALSNEKTVLFSGEGHYLLIDQCLFYQHGPGLSITSFSKVLALESYENGDCTFLQYNYSTSSGNEFFVIDRVTIDWRFQEKTREQLLSIDGDYLSKSHEKNNATLLSFAIFENGLFIVGARNVLKPYDPMLDYGILRFDLQTHEMASFLDSEANSLNRDPTFYTNGHFAFYSDINGVKTLRQIDFRQTLT